MICECCGAPMAWTNHDGVPLCEEHANAWLMGERMLARRPRRPQPGTLRAIAKGYGTKKRRVAA